MALAKTDAILFQSRTSVRPGETAIPVANNDAYIRTFRPHGPRPPFPLCQLHRRRINRP